jgi:hypothetical protein
MGVAGAGLRMMGAPGLAAVEPAGLLGREAENGGGAADLAAGPLDGLAVLRADQLGDLLGALGEPARNVVEGGGAYVRGGGGELVAYGVSSGDGLLHLLVGRDGDLSHETSVPRGGDVEGGLAGGLAAGEPEGVGGGHVPALPR